MATKSVRIKHISDGWRSILCSGDMQGVIDQAGADVISACESMSSISGGYVYRGQHFNYGGGRVGAYVQLEGIEAGIDEAVNKTLERAVSSL